MTRPKRDVAKEICLRIAAALFGGYAISWGIAAVIAITLPLPPPDSVLISSMVSFFVHLCFALWCFAVRFPRRSSELTAQRVQ